MCVYDQCGHAVSSVVVYILYFWDFTGFNFSVDDEFFRKKEFNGFK